MPMKNETPRICHIKYCTNETERGLRQCEACRVKAMKNEFYHLQDWDVWMAEEYKFIWRPVNHGI